jgi:hypothetical protein
MPSSAAYARRPFGVGMIRSATNRIVILLMLSSCLVFAACSAMCQQAEGAAWDSLPDAPMVQSTDALRFQPLHSKESALLGPRSGWSRAGALYKADSFKEEPQETNEFRRQLAALLRHPANYRPSTNGGLMRRAASTALGTFLRRTPSGKNKLDTSYLLGVLSSAVIQTAYRPYWNRPVSAPFSDFGSRVGNDAGMNLLHEFRPGLEELLKSHTPKFISRIEASIGRR